MEISIYITGRPGVGKKQLMIALNGFSNGSYQLLANDVTKFTTEYRSDKGVCTYHFLQRSD